MSNYLILTPINLCLKPKESEIHHKDTLNLNNSTSIPTMPNYHAMTQLSIKIFNIFSTSLLIESFYKLSNRLNIPYLKRNRTQLTDSVMNLKTALIIK